MKLEFARMGHPVLLSRAKDVTDVLAPEVQQVIRALEDALEARGSQELAAPQVFIPLRLFVMNVPPLPRTVFINPSMEVVDVTPVLAMETCCSVPGMVGEVSRPQAIFYCALDRAGQPIEGTLTGAAARAFQHAFDHLSGILYTMRLADLRRFGFAPEMAEPHE